jgi:serine/threonine protein kinase
LEEVKEQYPDKTETYHKDHHSRCKYYWTVEKHCLEKISTYGHPGIPPYRGTLQDEDGLSWLVFDKISARTFTGSNVTINNKEKDGTESVIRLIEPIAPCMQDLLDLDFLDHQEEPEHRLLNLASALGVAPKQSGDIRYIVHVLDKLIEQTLGILVHLHEAKIVHRDLKPGNLLIADGRVYLIDFGSAADLTTAGILNKNIGLSEKVAISPIYCAPEMFVNPSMPMVAVNFDCFSAALLFCQVLFQYLDERTDAGFFRQLAEADYSLDSWLETELQQDVRSTGLEQGLAVLAEVPGLWSFLQGMLLPDPRDRSSSKKALQDWKKIQKTMYNPQSQVSHGDVDGAYLTDVLESFELCSVGDLDSVSSASSSPLTVTRPLHYVATFRRNDPLGLVLAEMDGEIPQDMSESDQRLWKRVQDTALPGQVFVQGIVPGSQAEELGIFQVGDRLQGIGELPLAEGGFEKALGKFYFDSISTS